MYKVETQVLDRIKKHLKKLKKQEFSDVASEAGGTKEKLAAENDELIKLIEENYQYE